MTPTEGRPSVTAARRQKRSGLSRRLRPSSQDIEFTVQVGIDSGFAIAGVIGHKTFQYDLCGDAVNTAARMCSYSAPGRVHVSDATYALVRHKFGSVSRGQREIKGKGLMRTYFLRNEPPDAEPDGVVERM